MLLLIVNSQLWSVFRTVYQHYFIRQKFFKKKRAVKLNQIFVVFFFHRFTDEPTDIAAGIQTLCPDLMTCNIFI